MGQIGSIVIIISSDFSAKDFRDFYKFGFFKTKIKEKVKFYLKKKNRRFVFRSKELEPIIDFRPRVESWFPKAHRISHSNPPSETEMNSNNQCKLNLSL